MLHKAKIARALWGNARRQLRRALRLKPRARPWPPNGFDAIVRHHTELVTRFLEQAPPTWNVADKVVCEVGCSDCLAIGSLLLARGANQVDLVEPSPPILDPLQIRVLQTIKQNGLVLDPTLLHDDGQVAFDSTRVAYHNCFLQSLGFENRYDYLFSFDVLEHVADLDGFYAACRQLLKPGGQMFHSIDFSGHSEFEDPVPPLDFQTYPDWLFHLMYPPDSRTTRSFVSHHYRAIARAGLHVDETTVVRRADQAYLATVWPRLRRPARSLPPEEVGILQAVVVSHKQ